MNAILTKSGILIAFDGDRECVEVKGEEPRQQW